MHLHQIFTQKGKKKSCKIALSQMQMKLNSLSKLKYYMLYM